MPDDGVLAIDTESAAKAESFVVDVDGYEGPLDLLLTMARTQKVDLTRVSILQLTEQYLTFVAEAKRLRLELAADYLVMAAWLAFLKSRLLLPPDPEDEGPSGEDLAADLAFRLERLEALRAVAARLMGRDRLGQDFFARGEAEAFSETRHVAWTANLADLLNAYARVKTKDDFRPLHLQERRAIWTMEDALASLRGLIPETLDWATLASFLPAEWRGDPEKPRSAMASSFAATLEMAKSGEIELKQDRTFAPIFLRSKRRANAG